MGGQLGVGREGQLRGEGEERAAKGGGGEGRAVHPRGALGPWGTELQEARPPGAGWSSTSSARSQSEKRAGLSVRL